MKDHVFFSKGDYNKILTKCILRLRGFKIYFKKEQAFLKEEKLTKLRKYFDF